MRQSIFQQDLIFKFIQVRRGQVCDNPEKKFYTHTAVKDVIFRRDQKAYGYKVASSLRDTEKYDMEVERHTRIISIEADTNIRETNQIGLDRLYQAEITDYIKRSI